MTNEPLHIAFNNSQNPLAGFDIIQIEKLFRRDDMGHSPFDLHLVSFYIILLIEAGKGAHTIDFTEYPYASGTILTIRKDQLHKFHLYKEVKGTALLFN